MGSEQNNGTSFPPAEPKLCANGCGFFGTASNMNLCSKCYRDIRVEEEQAASAMAAMEKSLSINKPAKLPEAVFVNTDQVEKAVESVAKSSSSSVVVEPAVETKLANRCSSCNKKVGLTGFKCKCGSTFCGTHRYPEHHGCEFDFKGAGRDAIAKANPVVKADKVDRF